MILHTMVRKQLLFLLLLMISGWLDAQADFQNFNRKYDSLSAILFGPYADSIRIDANQNFEEVLAIFLKTGESLDYPVDSMKFVKMVAPENRSFRMFTWAVPLSGEDHIYSGIVQINKNDETLDVISLSPGKNEIDEDSVYSGNHWPAAVYFELIENRGSEFYTLLGWRDSGPGKTSRVIDIFHFDQDGTVLFGKPVFEVSDRSLQSRVIFQFTDQVPFHLAYEKQSPSVKARKKEWMIVFNHLGGNKPAMGRMFRAPVPVYDRFDGLIFSDGRWQYIKDVDARVETRKYQPPDRKSVV